RPTLSLLLPSTSLILLSSSHLSSIFFFNDTATTEIYTLSLHDALPISFEAQRPTKEELSRQGTAAHAGGEELRIGESSSGGTLRSEEHTSELQSLTKIVFRLLL